MKSYENIIITGANGFLGSYVCRVLRQNKISFLSLSHKDMDITNQESVFKVLRGADCIVHLAGKTVTSLNDSPESYFDTNTNGTLNILEFVQKYGIKKVIYASTVEVYSDKLPSGCISEFDLCAPPTYYGQSKLLGEIFCSAYAEKYGFDCLILRFGYLYGAGMHPSRVFPRLIQAAKTNKAIDLVVNKSNYFDSLYVEDAAQAVLKSIFCDSSGIQKMNIASEKKTNLNEVIDIVQSLYPNLKIQYKQGSRDKNSYYYDIFLAKKVIGYVPKYSLRRGIEIFLKAL